MSHTPLDAATTPAPAPLTEFAILALHADQETDAALAVHVFGWRWLLDPTQHLIGLWPPAVPTWISWNVPAGAMPVANPGAYGRFRDWHRLGSPADSPSTLGLPAWSTTFDGMAEVIAALRARQRYWTGTVGFAPDQPATAGFGAIAPSGHGWTHPDFQAVADTLPLATAQAALLAVHGLHHGAIQISAAREVRPAPTPQ